MIVLTSRNKNMQELYFFTTPKNIVDPLTQEGIRKRYYNSSIYYGDEKAGKSDMYCFRKYTKQHAYLQELAKTATYVWGTIIVSSAWNVTHGIVDLPDKYDAYARFVFGMEGKTFSRFCTFLYHKLERKDKSHMPTFDEGLAHYKDFAMIEGFNKVI